MKFTGSTDHDEAVGDHGEAKNVEDVERTQERGVRLEELPDETLNAVIRDEEIEPIAQEHCRAARDGGEIYHEKDEHRRRIRRAAPDGAGCRRRNRRPRAAQSVCRTCNREALRRNSPDAPDRDARGERCHEARAGRTAYAVRPFVDLDPDDPADDAARDAVADGEGAREIEVQTADEDRAAKRAEPERDEIAGIGERRARASIGRAGSAVR